MTTFIEKSGFFKYLSYKNEPRWFNILVHIGFGVGVLMTIAGLILTYLVF